jgi:hypothetical protein
MHVAAGGQMYIDFEKAWKSRLPGLNIFIPHAMGQRFELPQ